MSIYTIKSTDSKMKKLFKFIAIFLYKLYLLLELVLFPSFMLAVMVIIVLYPELHPELEESDVYAVGVIWGAIFGSGYFSFIMIPGFNEGKYHYLLFNRKCALDLSESIATPPDSFSVTPDLPYDIEEIISKKSCIITKYHNKEELIKILKLQDIQAANWDSGIYGGDIDNIFITPKVGEEVIFVGMTVETYMHYHKDNSSVYFNHISNFKNIDELFLFSSNRSCSCYEWSWVQNGYIKRSFIYVDGEVIEKGDITQQELSVKEKIEKDLLPNKDQKIAPYDWVWEDTVTEIMRLWCPSVKNLEKGSKFPPSVGEVAKPSEDCRGR